MLPQNKPVKTSQPVNDEPELDVDDVNTIAKFLDALMEADFENSEERMATSAC